MSAVTSSELSPRNVYLPFLADSSPQLATTSAATWFWFSLYMLVLLALVCAWKQLTWTQRIRVWGGINVVAAVATAVMYKVESSGLREAGYPVLAPYMASGFMWALIWSPALPVLIITSHLLTRLRSRLTIENGPTP